VRIIGGAWRGRALTAPAGLVTRPTAARVRQALFDMLLHAPWGGRSAVDGVRVLDAFAGAGALGLEALSRGAAHATFIERDRAALAALRINIQACRAELACDVLAADACAPPPGRPASLVLLDPPYGGDLAVRAIAALAAAGWIAPGALIAAETASDDPEPREVFAAEKLAERAHGTAKLTFWRA
jgi:16S rRNA (guanine966-N2)-methyltransferase